MHTDDAVARALRSRAQTVAVVEATTGGLVSASLLGSSGASKYFVGSMVVYSNQGAKAQLPLEVRKQLGSPQQNYSSHANYKHSKVVFTQVLAQHVRELMGADWGLAESGAVEAQTLPAHLRGAVGKELFTTVSIAGPGGLLQTKTFDASGALGRRELMAHFTSQALEFLAETIQARPASRL